ncbi:MAG: hypothetical protein U0232_15685 [Thermomicrobiales bacterium]
MVSAVVMVVVMAACWGQYSRGESVAVVEIARRYRLLMVPDQSGFRGQVNACLALGGVLQDFGVGIVTIAGWIDASDSAFFSWGRSIKVMAMIWRRWTRRPVPTIIDLQPVNGARLATLRRIVGAR